MGRQPLQFSYSYLDIAKATNLGVDEIQQRQEAGEFDSSNLLSVFEFVVKNCTPELAEELKEAMLSRGLPRK